MKAVIENREGNKVEFKYEIGVKEFNKAVNEAYLENRHYITIPGFRKGKAPRQIIELNFGHDIFYEDALNKILPESYEKAVEELGLEPVSMPELDLEDIEKGQPVVVKIEVEVKPEVKLGDYKSVEVEKVEYEVTEEMLENEIKSIQEMNARLVDAGDREVKEGDLVTIDYKGFVGEDQFEGGTAEGHQLEIGSGQFIPGFEEQLVGKSKDEEIDVEVTFPEEYHAEDLAGAEAIFKVVIHDIKEKEYPELDDEFAKDVSEFDTLEEYKEDIKAKLVEKSKEQEEAEQEGAIVDAVVEIAEVDIPEAMIETQLENEIAELNQTLSMQGIGLDQYLELTGGNIEDIKEQIRPMAEARVKGDLVLEAIALEEGIEITEEDRIDELKKMAEMYGQADADEFVEEMKKGDITFLDKALINGKVIDFLKENVKFK